jgi:hypothetical protein
MTGRDHRAPWPGPWVAKFTDGPCQGDSRSWAIGPIWREICLAPIPRREGRWFICDGDGIQPANSDAEIEPWPNQTRYRLRFTRYTKLLGERTMVAYYSSSTRKSPGRFRPFLSNLSEKGRRAGSL